IGGKSHPIAIATKIITHCTYHCECSRMTGYYVFLCGIVLISLQRQIRIFFLNYFQYFLPGKYFITCPSIATKGHKFNKTHMYWFMPRPLYKIKDLILIKSFHSNHINFYMEVFTDQQLNIIIYSFELIPSGHQLKLIRL